MEEFTAAKGKKFLKRDQRELIKKIVIYFFMVAMLVFSLFPYYYMINISLMPSFLAAGTFFGRLPIRSER